MKASAPNKQGELLIAPPHISFTNGGKTTAI